MMSTQQTWVPLTQEMKDKMDQWRISADPTVRFTNGYYQLQKQLILEDYYRLCKDAGNDFEAVHEARDILFFAMDNLRVEYEKDTQLWIELSLSMMGCWNPWQKTK